MFEYITETVRNVWNRLVEAIQDFLIRWGERLEYNEEHQWYIDAIKEYDSNYEPCQADIVILENIKDYLDSNFPNGLEDKFIGLSEEELVSTFREIAEDSSKLMGVSISEVNFFTPESEEDIYVYGFYNRSDNSININLAMLLSGDMTLVKEQFYTIFHEMKHALQWAVVANPENYNYPDELVEVWARNFLHYIPIYEDDEAYFKQPLENDTFGLELVMKGEISIDGLKKSLV